MTTYSTGCAEFCSLSRECDGWDASNIEFSAEPYDMSIIGPRIPFPSPCFKIDSNRRKASILGTDVLHAERSLEMKRLESRRCRELDVLTRTEFQGSMFRVAAVRRFDARRQRLKRPNLDYLRAKPYLI